MHNPRLTDGGPGVALGKIRFIAERHGLPNDLVDKIMREAMSECGSGSFGAWLDPAVCTEGDPEPPIALIGPGAEWFAALLARLLRLAGIHAQVIPWDLLLDGGTNFDTEARPTVAVLLGPPPGPPSDIRIAALAERSSILVADEQRSPFELIQVVDFDLVPPRVEALDNFCKA